MKLETVTWVMMMLVVVTSAQSSYGQGQEYGRVRGRLQNGGYGRALQNQNQQRRDANRFTGQADQRARWAGQSALRDNSLLQNQAASRRRAQAANQDFGRFSNNFADIAKQIRNEALRNHYVINDDAKYRRNNQNSAQGANQAKAKKTAFNKVDNVDDNLNYAFSRKFDKTSSENGGFEEENGKNLKKLNLIDEREKARNLLRGDSEVSRKQSDHQKTAKNQEKKSNANQKQAQDGQFGFNDVKVDQAGHRSDDRAVDFDRSDSKYLEQESGKEEAVRLAKELAQQNADYNNEANAKAGAVRNVNDKKYYGGKELGGLSSSGAGHDGYGPDNAAQAGAAVGGNKAKHEGSGGAIQSGFGEKASQQERAKEQASATAQSSAQAVNEYQQNKDKLAYNQRTGLQDRTNGEFRQGLKDTSSRGFSGNNAEAAKSAAESDKSASASQSASNLEAKEKNDNEALQDRQYFRKIQNDDSETYTRRKQFYHNKKEGGNNDEKLKYNRKKNVHNFGAADEAELAKQNKFKNLHEDGKVSSQVRNFEDLVDRRNSQQQDRQNSQGAARSFATKQAQEEAAAQAAANGAEKALAKTNSDDSQSSSYIRQDTLLDQKDDQQRGQQQNRDSANSVAVDVEYYRPTNNAPLGELQARDFIGPDVLSPPAQQKAAKGVNVPDVVVDIQPLPTPPKVTQPKRSQPLPPLPAVKQVKTFQPYKKNQEQPSYDTGRSSNLQVFNRKPQFSRINPSTFFSGPRRSPFPSKQQSVPRSRFSLHGLGTGSRFASRGSFFNNAFRGRRW